MPWRPVPLSYGVAIYPFQPGSSSTELPLQIGDQLYVIEQGGKHGDWYRGYLVAPPSLLSALRPSTRSLPGGDARVFSGIFPKCCIEIREELGEDVSRPSSVGSSHHQTKKPPAPVPMLKIGDETAMSPEPLVDEISSCLREWYLVQLPELALKRDYDLLENTSVVISKLEYARRQLLNDILTELERVSLREDAVMNLMRANRMLSGEVVVRDSYGRLLTGEDSAVEMASSTVHAVLLDITTNEKAGSTEDINGHSHDVDDDTASKLRRSNTSATGRHSRLSRRLSKISIVNGNTANHSTSTGPDRTSNISMIAEEEPDKTLHFLGNWKQLSSVQLMDLLPKVMFVPEAEIVDQLEDVFDSLFAILVHKSGESKYEDLIFNALVRVLGITHDRRFDIEAVVNQYLDEQFEFPLAAACLLRSLTRLLQSVSDPQSARDLRAFFKVGRPFIKLMITSHQQSRSRRTSQSLLANHRTFKEDMQAILFGLQMMMRSETAALIGNKTMLVQHFHSWLPELLPAFTKDEVIRIAVNFVDASHDAKGKLILHRLILILNYTKLDSLWSDAADRSVLVRNCMRWLSHYWGTTDEITGQWREQVRLCCSVIAQLLKRPTAALHDFLPRIVASYSTILMTSTPKKKSMSYLFATSYPFVSKSIGPDEQADEVLLELAALISAICKISPPMTIKLQEQNLSAYILALLEIQTSLLDCDSYPTSWLSLNIYHHHSTMNVLLYISKILHLHFLPAPELAERFDMDLWKAFFTLLLRLVNSSALALENFAEQKRRAVWKIAGDVRESGATLLRQSWEAIGWEASPDDERRYDLKYLGGYQVQYVPSLIPPIMSLCLSMHEGLRRVAVEILQTMIVSEWSLGEDTVLIETEMISSLDILFKSQHVPNEATDKLFLSELRLLFSTIADQADDALWLALDELLTAVDELISLLAARSAASSDQSLAASEHTLAITEFMASMRNRDLFIRYIHELAYSYDRAQPPQPVLAAAALQRHAALFPWDPDETLAATSSPNFPEQSAFERKEALYLAVISRLEDGEAWASAIQCYKELADQYENTTMEFGKLARAQRAMARINEVRERRAPSRAAGARSATRDMNGA